ncbi:hypothetical protein [Agrobacterium tumefaciens]|uniref:Uncharacterized protein n=1 Tax=Agrobacterium tumefaciens TaxID=358 RepID=A0A4D7YE34_AGRTU|nr:hypothetical protein [Agrobacterium tumefaciens]QCL92898.1 hypothetical protein CFBP7129_00830 [Agrobacterium tumefaciens]
MKKSDTFTVPSLAEADAVYGDLERKRAELISQQSTLRVELRAIEKELGAEKAASYSASVAALLGEGDGSDLTQQKRARAIDVKKLLADLDAAISIIDRRMADQQPKANTAAVEACRAEYGKHVKRMVESFRALQLARENYENFREDMEREDLRWTRLGPMSPTFLGDYRDGHVQRFIREAKELGYV